MMFLFIFTFSSLSNHPVAYVLFLLFNGVNNGNTTKINKVKFI
jgi:hypothetical protein